MGEKGMGVRTDRQGDGHRTPARMDGYWLVRQLRLAWVYLPPSWPSPFPSWRSRFGTVPEYDRSMGPKVSPAWSHTVNEYHSTATCWKEHCHMMADRGLRWLKWSDWNSSVCWSLRR